MCRKSCNTECKNYVECHHFKSPLHSSPLLFNLMQWCCQSRSFDPQSVKHGLDLVEGLFWINLRPVRCHSIHLKRKGRHSTHMSIYILYTILRYVLFKCVYIYVYIVLCRFTHTSAFAYVFLCLSMSASRVGANSNNLFPYVLGLGSQAFPKIHWVT